MSCYYTFIVRAPINNSVLFINAEGITLTKINKRSVLFCSVLFFSGDKKESCISLRARNKDIWLTYCC